MSRVPELRDVPLAVLGQLNPVPPDFLRQLSKDKELFADLPPGVQSQVTPSFLFSFSFPPAHPFSSLFRAKHYSVMGSRERFLC